MPRFAPLPVGPQVTLTAGPARAIVVPACGARLVRFDIGDTPILRPAPDKLEGQPPYAYAGFPLLPYSGPIFSGGFSFGANRYGLVRNLPAEADATHGVGWIRPWTVAAQTPAMLSLALDYRPADGLFPFAWRATLTYSLTPAALEVEMTLVNSDICPMPAGFGFHPYFAKPAGASLQFQHGRIWPPDAPDAVLKGSHPPPEGLDFNAGIGLDGLVADRCFDDWNGVATLRAADREVRLTASQEFGKLQLYAPWYDPYVCIEPVSNANDGFNRAAHGIPGHDVVVLQPGGTLTGRLRIDAGLGARA